MKYVSLLLFAVLVCGRFWQSFTTTHSRPFPQRSRSKNTVTYALVATIWTTITFWLTNHQRNPLWLFSLAKFWGENYTSETLLLCGRWRVHRQHQSYVSYVVILMTSAVTSMCRCIGCVKDEYYINHLITLQQRKRQKIRPLEITNSGILLY